MQNQVTENPLRNACIFIGGFLAFSSIGGILMPMLLGLPKIFVYCGCIQLAIGLMLLACGWFLSNAKAIWGCLAVAFLIWLPNTCVFIFSVFPLLK